jgi:hypothetical protein
MMQQYIQNSKVRFSLISKKNCVLLIVLLSGLISHRALAQTPDSTEVNIQKIIDAIKASNSNEQDDFLTNGKKELWVKSYKRWVPSDLVVMKKESPDILAFLKMAAKYKRYDILAQLLPDYYLDNGGVKKWVEDIGWVDL